MSKGKIILASVIIWIVSLFISWMSCGWLFNWIYVLSPVEAWKEQAAVMFTNNIIGMNVLGLVKAFIFVIVFVVLYKGIPSHGVIKGIVYGILIWATGVLTGVITMPFYMALVSTVAFYWAAQALIINIIAGSIVGVMIKK